MQHIAPATLDAYYANSLPATEARLIRNHLVWCTDCRRTVLQMKSLTGLLRRLVNDPAGLDDAEDTAAAPREGDPLLCEGTT